jgi:hypothetical protein
MHNQLAITVKDQHRGFCLGKYVHAKMNSILPCFQQKIICGRMRVKAGGSWIKQLIMLSWLK